MVAIQFTNRFFGFQPKVRECGQLFQNLRPELLCVFAVLFCVSVRTFRFSHIRPPVKIINAHSGMEGLCKTTRRFRAVNQREAGAGFGEGTPQQDRVCAAMKAAERSCVSKMEGHCPDKLGGICDRGYHGLWGTSRWFCEFYCGKAVIVGLIFRKT